MDYLQIVVRLRRPTSKLCSVLRLAIVGETVKPCLGLNGWEERKDGSYKEKIAWQERWPMIERCSQSTVTLHEGSQWNKSLCLNFLPHTFFPQCNLKPECWEVHSCLLWWSAFQGTELIGGRTRMSKKTEPWFLFLKRVSNNPVWSSPCAIYGHSHYMYSNQWNKNFIKNYKGIMRILC